MSERTRESGSEASGSDYRQGNGDGRQEQGASGVVGAIREQASTLRDRVSDTVSSVAEDQKKRAAGGVHDAAQATREAARRLQENDQGWMASIVGSAADVLNDFSDTLRQSDFRTLYERVERFAQEQPVMFAAGAFAAGMILARTTRLGMDAGSTASGPSRGASTSTTYGGPSTSYAGPTSFTEAGREC